MSQRFQAARDRGEDVPYADPAEVKEQLRALLEQHEKEKQQLYTPSETLR